MNRFASTHCALIVTLNRLSKIKNLSQPLPHYAEAAVGRDLALYAEC